MRARTFLIRIPACLALALLALLALAPPGAARAGETVMPVWRELTPPLVGGHRLVYVPTQRAMYQVGGNVPGDFELEFPQPVIFFDQVPAIWVLPLDGGAPLRLATLPVADFRVDLMGAVFYEPQGDRLVHLRTTMRVHGVTSPLSTWQAVTPAGAPPPVDGPAVYDAAGKRAILVTRSAPVRTFSLITTPGAEAWSELATVGAPGSLSATAQAVLDSTGERLVVVDCGASPPTVWTLSLATSTWTAWSPVIEGPSPGNLGGVAMAWDEGGHRLLAFGGSTIGTWTEAVSHLWQLALEPAAKWSLVPGTSPPVPDPRAWAALALDPVLGRLLMNGGAIGPDRRAQASSTRDRGLWSHPLGADTSGWTAPTPPSPPHTLVGMAAAADTGARVWYVHGGSSWGYNPVTSSTLWRVPFDDPTRWEPIEATSDGNYRSRFHELVDDPTRNELWQFSPLRRLRLDDPIAWETLSPTGTGPTDSYNAAALYDAPRDRILYFAPRPGVLPGIEVWALAPGATPPAWTLVPTTGGAPLLDDGYTANYDPIRDRVIVFGGFYNESGGMSVGNHSTDSTWALDFSVSPAAWSRLPSLGSDRSRAGHTAVIDPKRNLLIVAFGALEQQGGCCINSYTRTDVWALDLRDPGGWIPLVPNTSSPRPRIWGIAAFDAQRDRMLLYGGQSLTEAMILIEEWGYEDAVWELDFDQAVPLAVDLVEAVERDGAVHLSWHSADAGGLSATVERQDLPDDAWRALGAAVVDAGSRDRLVFVDADVVAGRTYAYRMRWFEGGVAHTGPPVEVAVGSGPGSGGGPALALASRNPSPDGWVVHVRVREGVAAAGERLELLDVRGRRVWSRSLAGLPAGVHAIAVPQPDGAGAGIYFARWRRAVPDGGTPTLRLVRLPD